LSRDYLRLCTLPLVDIPSSQVNILDGNAEDLIAGCKAYEERIKSYGGVELFLAGIGADGHIAFNVSARPYAFSYELTTALLGTWYVR
jgi:6-phosphogluconolactonase/glucosamine-6-phosphate isomerase/deaminase